MCGGPPPRTTADGEAGTFDLPLFGAVALCLVVIVGSLSYLDGGGRARTVEWAGLPQGGRELRGAHAVYVYSPGCGQCTAANEAIVALQREHPDVRVVMCDLTDPQGWRDAQRIQDALARAYRAPQAALGQIPPGLFTPRGYFIGDEAVAPSIEALGSGPPSALPVFEVPEATTRPSVSLAAGTVVGLAGLVDGVNPCALAGLAFLLAYLMHLGLTARTVLLAGLLFAAGTFAAYFAAGLGLYFAVAGSTAVPGARALVYGGATACCIVFTARAWHMVALGPRGQHTVSSDTRRLEHSLVRKMARPTLVWLGAPVMGGSFAVLELACTGQLYLPAIALLSREGLLRQAVAGLVLYNACFIVAPLALTLTVAAAGRALAASRFEAIAQRARVGIAFVLALLCIYMVQEVQRVAGSL